MAKHAELTPEQQESLNRLYEHWVNLNAGLRLAMVAVGEAEAHLHAFARTCAPEGFKAGAVHRDAPDGDSCIEIHVTK